MKNQEKASAGCWKCKIPDIKFFINPLIADALLAKPAEEKVEIIIAGTKKFGCTLHGEVPVYCTCSRGLKCIHCLTTCSTHCSTSHVLWETKDEKSKVRTIEETTTNIAGMFCSCPKKGAISKFCSACNVFVCKAPCPWHNNNHAKMIRETNIQLIEMFEKDTEVARTTLAAIEKSQVIDDVETLIDTIKEEMERLKFQPGSSLESFMTLSKKKENLEQALKSNKETVSMIEMVIWTMEEIAVYGGRDNRGAMIVGMKDVSRLIRRLVARSKEVFKAEDLQENDEQVIATLERRNERETSDNNQIQDAQNAAAKEGNAKRKRGGNKNQLKKKNPAKSATVTRSAALLIQGEEELPSSAVESQEEEAGPSLRLNRPPSATIEAMGSVTELGQSASIGGSFPVRGTVNSPQSLFMKEGELRRPLEGVFLTPLPQMLRPSTQILQAGAPLQLSRASSLSRTPETPSSLASESSSISQMSGVSKAIKQEMLDEYEGSIGSDMDILEDLEEDEEEWSGYCIGVDDAEVFRFVKEDQLKLFEENSNFVMKETRRITEFVKEKTVGVKDFGLGGRTFGVRFVMIEKTKDGKIKGNFLDVLTCEDTVKMENCVELGKELRTVKFVDVSLSNATFFNKRIIENKVKNFSYYTEMDAQVIQSAFNQEFRKVFKIRRLKERSKRGQQEAEIFDKDGNSMLAKLVEGNVMLDVSQVGANEVDYKAMCVPWNRGRRCGTSNVCIKMKLHCCLQCKVGHKSSAAMICKGGRTDYRQTWEEIEDVELKAEL